MMQCQAIAELLPWFLNRTLADGERREVRLHLAGCGECRRALQEARLMWTVGQAHVPVATLVDYAFKRAIAPFDERVIEQHLAACPQCAAELALAQESWRWAEGAVTEVAPEVETVTPLPVSKGRTSWWASLREPRWALAAALVALVIFSGWLWRRERMRQADLAAQTRVMSEQLAGLTAENQRLRQAEAALRQEQERAHQQLAQLQARLQDSALSPSPQLNIPVRDLRPSELLRGGQPTFVNELELPAQAQFVTLILNSQSAANYLRYRLEIRRGRALVWRAAGLVRNPAHDYTINLPTKYLTPGSYTLNIYGQARGARVKVDSYRVRVKPARD